MTDNLSQKLKAISEVLAACNKESVTLLYATVVGSVAYGNATSNSDLDIRFVFASTPERYLGFGGIDSLTVKTEDIFGYELGKWIQLLLSNNPTVMEMLFMESESVLYLHPSLQILFDNRDKFLSKKCYHSYMKYAEGQMYKAQSCTKEVVQRLLDFEEVLTLNGVDLQNLSVKQIVRDKLADYPEHFVAQQFMGVTIGAIIDNYSTFKQKKFPYSDLGKKRRDYLLKMGFDGKNVSHAIRLGRTCLDIFEKRELKVRRADAQHFLDIKNGLYSLEELQREFDVLKESVIRVFDKSKLPEVPDRDFAEKICVSVLKNVLFEVGK